MRKFRLQILGVREETAVNRVNNWLCSNLPTAKKSSVQTTNGIVTARDFVELEVDIALGIRVE